MASQYINPQRPSPTAARLLMPGGGRYATPKTARILTPHTPSLANGILVSHPVCLFDTIDHITNLSPVGNIYIRDVTEFDATGHTPERTESISGITIETSVTAARNAGHTSTTDAQIRAAYAECRQILTAAEPAYWPPNRIDLYPDQPSVSDRPVPGPNKPRRADAMALYDVTLQADADTGGGRDHAGGYASEKIDHTRVLSFYGTAPGYTVEIPFTIQASYNAKKNAPVTFGGPTVTPALTVTPAARIIIIGDQKWSNTPLPESPSISYADAAMTLDDPLTFPECPYTNKSRVIECTGTVRFPVPPSRTVALALSPFGHNTPGITYADTFLGRNTIAPSDHTVIADTLFDLSLHCNFHLGRIVL